MRDLSRPLERWLTLDQGLVRCPRMQSVMAGCGACPCFCRLDDSTSSVICSYPIPARDTFSRRATHDQAVRIGLSQGLVRT